MIDFKQIGLRKFNLYKMVFTLIIVVMETALHLTMARLLRNKTFVVIQERI